MTKGGQLKNATEIEVVTSETEVSSDSSSTETSNRRAFMTGALAATAGVVAASALGSKKAEANPMAMVASSANFSFTYSTNLWSIGSQDGSIRYIEGDSTNTAVALFYNNAEKLKTTDDGIEVVGDLAVDNSGLYTLKTSTSGSLKYQSLKITNEQTTGAARLYAIQGASGSETCSLLVSSYNDSSSTAGMSRSGGMSLIYHEIGTQGLTLGTGNASQLLLTTNNTEALTIDTDQNATFSGDVSINGNLIGDVSVSGNMKLSSNGVAEPWLELENTGGSGGDARIIFSETVENFSWACGIDDSLNSFRISRGATAGVARGGTNDALIIESNLNATFGAKVTATDFTATSDRSLKNNFQTIENPLERLLGLKGYIHGWKAGGEDSFGFIHDEVEASEPLLAIRNEEGLGSVNYQKVVPLLVEATREMKAESDNKDKEIAELKTRLEKLEKLLG